MPEWRILATLASYEPQSVMQLCAKTLYDQPRLTKTLARMDEAGLVNRTQDSADRRVVRVSLTEAGRERVSGLLDLARSHETRALASLTPAERRQLKSILRKLM